MKTPITILLAEDFSISRKAQKKILEQLGYTQIVEADDGEAAIDLLNKHTNIDLIISDWNMPKVDGYALLNWVRKNDRYQKIPFIMATAQGEKRLSGKAVESGATAFITKPFTSDELGAAIRDAVESQPTVSEPELIAPKKRSTDKLELKVAHIQITDHLALGVLTHLLKTGEWTTKYFDLNPLCMPSWNYVQKAVEKKKTDAAFALAPICMDLFSVNVPIQLVLFAHKNGSICVKNKLGAQHEPLHQYLKGKIFLLPHILSVHHMLVDMFLREIGLRLGPVGKKNVDVFYEVVPPVEMPQFLANTPNACGFVVAEPMGKKSIQNGVSDRLFLSGDLWENHPCCVVVMQKDIIDRHPDAVYEFVELIVKAGQYIANNPKSSAEIGVDFLDPHHQLGLTSAIIESILTEPRGVKTDDLMPNIDDLDKIQNYMNKIMGIGNLIDLDRFVDKRFAESACQSLPSGRASLIREPNEILTTLINRQFYKGHPEPVETFQVEENDSSLSFKISSEMRLVDRLVNQTREFLKRSGFDVFSEFRLVLRELLINAVEHGNKNISSRKVVCSITKLQNSVFKISVTDEGDGFDYKRLNTTIPKDASQIRHRGFALIHSFSKKIEFNEKGNQVTAYVQLHQKTQFDVTQDGQWKIICPSGDITASVADAFRMLLYKFVEEGFTKFRFDFKQVRDLDSVSLSIFIVLHKILSDKKPELEIIHVCDDLLNLFRMTRLDKTFRIRSAK